MVSPVTRKGYGYFIVNDSGREVEFRMRFRFLDPIPDLDVSGKRVVLVPPLKSYESLWICLPFLVFCLYGGLLGGICGLVAMQFNFVLFRNDCSLLTKYLLSGLINSFAGLLYFGIALILVYGFGIKALGTPAIQHRPQLWLLLAFTTFLGLVAVPALWFIKKLQLHFSGDGKKMGLLKQGFGSVLGFMILVAIAFIIAVVCLCFIK
jgi:hypothetical protein